MPSFTDCEGREWTIRLTVGLVGTLRQDAGINLSEVIREPEKFAALVFGDPEALGKLYWTLCRKQAEAAGIDPQSFADGFDGPTIEAASGAFMEAIADFFHRSKVAAGLKQRMPAMMEDVDKKTIEEIDRMVKATTSKLSAGDLPASSESIPPT